MFDKLQQHPTLLSYRKQYEMLPSRDRMALKLLAIALGLFLLYFAMWQPAYEYKVQAENDLLQNQKLQALVDENRATLANIARQGASGNASSTLDSQQLVSSVTNLARQKGVTLKRFEPSGDKKLKVWVDDVSFDKVILWLATLKKSLHIKVEQISVEKDDAPGHISARLTLSS